MRAASALLVRFGRDERGVFAILFAMLALVLVAMGGAAIDYVMVEQARNRAQIALDSAALALQPSIGSNSEDQLRAKAQALLLERLDDASIDAEVDAARIDTVAGSLYLEAELTVPLNFVALVGVPSLTARVATQATRKRLNLEVAMVLDNSQSMASESRMTNLVAATRCAANILYYGSVDASCAVANGAQANANVKLGIVPFTSLVNVGTNNANAAWMERGRIGADVLANANFDNDDYDGNSFAGPVDRIALFSNFTADPVGGQNLADWGGCVQSRGFPLDTNDAAPVAGTDTMFTPYLAPDEPGRGDYEGGRNDYLKDNPTQCTNVPPVWTWTQTKTRCNRAGNNKTDYDRASCSGPTTDTYDQRDQRGIETATVSATPPGSLFNNTPTCSESYSSSGNNNNRTNKRTTTCTYNFSDQELTERLCKYVPTRLTGIYQFPSRGTTPPRGPNMDCPVNAITPLTATPATITTAIAGLKPQGYTNVHAGAEWGMRVLTPAAPFAEGGDFDQATSKVMIVMTDGDNYVYAPAGHAYYGYQWNGELADPRPGRSSLLDAGALEALMDERLAATCDNAKAMGIQIYTIGLAASTKNKALLTACASGSEKAYFPTQSSQLIDVFKAIANELSALRLEL